MTCYDFEVDPSFIVGGRLKRRDTSNGDIFIGKKGGRVFCVKRNMHVRYPAKDLPESVYKAYLETAQKLDNKQKNMKRLMSSISVDRDRVVKEEDHFWDSDNMFVTVSAWIPDCLPDDYSFASRSAKEFIGLALDFAERLRILHSCGVIHGDLK